MMGRNFRLTRPTIAIRAENGREICITLPKGATLAIRTVSADHGLVGVEWDGTTVRVFAEDLKARAIPVKI